MTKTLKTESPFMIRDLETLRALSDPLRMQIVELLLYEKQTVKQVAEKLGLAASKLYYHFNTLEKLGLIEVVETRMVANMQEKSYKATANSVSVDPALLTFSTEEGKENISTMLASSIDATREDILRSLQARQFQLEQGAQEQPRRFIINRLTSRVTEERITEFQDRLVALMHEFEDEDLKTKNKDAQTYALTVAFYPSFYFQKPTKKEKKK
ncbi:MAG: helix-turn-helix domain-containing protein [Chloroflexota bacterium]